MPFASSTRSGLPTLRSSSSRDRQNPAHSPPCAAQFFEFGIAEGLRLDKQKVMTTDERVLSRRRAPNSWSHEQPRTRAPEVEQVRRSIADDVEPPPGTISTRFCHVTLPAAEAVRKSSFMADDIAKCGGATA